MVSDAIRTSGSHDGRPPTQTEPVYQLQYQAQQHSQGGGALRTMSKRDCKLGVEWGMFALLGGAEKVSYTADFWHILFVVRGRAFLTLGDGYAVPCPDLLLVEGAAAEVPCGSYYSVRTAIAVAHVTLLYYKTRGDECAGSDQGKAGSLSDRGV